MNLDEYRCTSCGEIYVEYECDLFEPCNLCEGVLEIIE